MQSNLLEDSILKKKLKHIHNCISNLFWIKIYIDTIFIWFDHAWTHYTVLYEKYMFIDNDGHDHSENV